MDSEHICDNKGFVMVMPSTEYKFKLIILKNVNKSLAEFVLGASASRRSLASSAQPTTHNPTIHSLWIMSFDPIASSSRKDSATDKASERLGPAVCQSGLVAFKLVVAADECFELVDNVGFLPLRHIFDSCGPDAALEHSWVNRYFVTMVLIPLVTAYLSEQTTHSSEMIARAFEYHYREDEISFLSTDYHVISNTKELAQYLRHPNHDSLSENQATLLYFSLSGNVWSEVLWCPDAPRERAGQLAACPAPSPGLPCRDSSGTEPLSSCDCQKFGSDYSFYAGPDQLAELFVSPPPECVELDDVFKSVEFDAFVTGEKNKSKKRLAEHQSADEELMNYCYSHFTALKFAGLLRNGQIQARNKNGVLLPLLPKDKAFSSFYVKGEYKLPLYRFRLRLKSSCKASDSFQITIQFCPKCKRFVSIIWNGLFEPILAEDEFDIPFNLWSLRDTLLNSVRRDASFVEHFRPLPLMDDGQPISIRRAKWLFDRAGIWFRKDDAHRELNAPVAVMGDVHGQITTVQRVYDVALTNRKVSYGFGKQQHSRSFRSLLRSQRGGFQLRRYPS
jgi:hypothetical protein